MIYFGYLKIVIYKRYPNIIKDFIHNNIYSKTKIFVFCMAVVAKKLFSIQILFDFISKNIKKE